MNLSGKFIVFEGPDGAGKTSQMDSLWRWLLTEGYRAERVREPGSTQLGEIIRDLLSHHDMTPETELLLFSAARAELVREQILPLIDDGITVLCDRYIYSTFAYQVRARGMPFYRVSMITEFATGGLTPDLIFYLDVDYEEALGRMRDKDRFDRESMEFHSEVRKGYKQMIKNMNGNPESPNPWEVIYTTGKTFDETQAEIRTRLKERFG